MKSNKKVVVITGGSQGLGKGLAAVLSKENQVVILSNDATSLRQTLSELDCNGLLCDITNPDHVEGAIFEIAKKYGRIDILINNAGIWVGGKLEQNSYEEIAKVILVNTVGTIYVTKAVLPYMKKQKNGKILNINSIDGVGSKTDRSVYSASKWGVTGFTDCMRKELKSYGIQVMGFYPSLMKTGLFKSSGAKRDMSSAMSIEDAVKVIYFMLSFENGLVPETLILKDIHYEL